MKRYLTRCLCFAVAVFFILPFVTISPFANASARTAEGPFYDVTCSYDRVTQKVKIGYRMKNENVKKYGDSKISVYALHASGSVNDILPDEDEPIASGYVPSNKASIEFEVATLGQRLSSYVLAIGEGENTVYSDAIYPYVTTCACDSAFKGFEPVDPSISCETYGGTVIVDVDVYELVSRSGGIVASYDTETFSFSIPYLKALDTKMKNYRSNGCDVYIRFCNRPSSITNSSITDDLGVYYYAFSRFLYSRYSTDEYGGLDGFVLGRSSDIATITVRECASLIYAVSAGVSDLGRTASVVVPVPDVFETAAGFIDGLCGVLGVSECPMFTVMVESSCVPYNADNDYEENISSDPDADKAAELGDFTDDLPAIKARIRALASESHVIYSQVLYCWTPPDDLVGLAKTAAYVYNYYRAFADGGVTSFITSVDKNISENLAGIMRYIDTNRSGEYLNGRNILDFYGIKSWAEEFDGFNVRKTIKRTSTVYEVEHIIPGGVIGETAYFDFSKIHDKNGWYGGLGCVSLTSGNIDSSRALIAEFYPNGSWRYSSSITYAYRYTESFKYTDYIALEFSIEAPDPGEYSLEVMLGGDGFVSEYASGGFEAGKRYVVYLNTTEFTENNPVKYFRILAYGTSSERYKLCLHSVKAESTKYGSEQLGNYIEAERERLKKLNDDDVSSGRIDPLAIFFVVATIFVTVLIMITISRKKRKDNYRKDDFEK